MKPHSQQGFSLVEILIAVILGLVLMTGILAVFVSNKQSFRIQDGLARVQENARFAQFIISNEIRMAGFQGCPKLSIVTPTNQIAAPTLAQGLTTATAIQGYDSITSAPSWITANIAAGTNIPANTSILVVQEASPLSSNLAADMTATSDDLSLAKTALTINSGDIVLISDCQSSDIFIAGNGSSATAVTHPAGNNISSQLSKIYHTDARVFLLQTYAFYIKNTGRINTQGQPIYSLYRQNIKGTEEELVEGVQNMQITYGVDTDNDGAVDTYLSATQVTAQTYWPQVVTANVDMLLNTVEGVNSKSQAYKYMGSSYTSTDNLLRREWDVFIKLRNRIV